MPIPTKKEIKEIERDLEREHNIKLWDNLYKFHKRCGIPQAEPDAYKQHDLQTPTYKKMGFTEQEAVMIFADHRFMTRSILADKYGINRCFPDDPKKPANIVQRIYQDVVKKPEVYAEYITENEIKEIVDLVKSRMVTGNFEKPMETLPSKSVKYAIAQPIADMVRKVERINDKGFNLLEQKFDSISMKKEIKNMDLKKLAEVAKIMNDIKRLEKGEATQHVVNYIAGQDLDKKDTSELIEILNSTANPE